MDINLGFLNKEQDSFYFSRMRNNEFDGAFQNGKSYVGCERAFTHLFTFSNYAMAIGRQEYKALRQTTMKTFFKICPDQLIHKHDEQAGYTVFINKSFIYWMHLDAFDEQDLRGLEINSALLDQAEEIYEPIYNVLDARIGRWDQAQVPLHLLESLIPDNMKEMLFKLKRDSKDTRLINEFIKKETLWPRHPKRGHFLVPNYMDVLCNIADDEEFHWTYRYYNPESQEVKPDHFYVHGEMDQNLGDPRSYQQMLLRDNEWVDKYVKGKRGQSKAQIHKLDPLSIINLDDYDEDARNSFLETLRSKGALYRILDHGETGITCVLWCAVINQVHIFYREYYVQGALISVNRQAITDLSFNESYLDDYADPQIFKITQQSVSGVKAGFWTVANEYLDTEEIDVPPIAWSPADNNEYATRNRINELLCLNPKYFHPLTKASPAPAIYFIKKSKTYQYGCEFAINQIKSQRRTLLGSDNGKNLYSEERDENIVDHAYDCVRYKISMHAGGKLEVKKKPPRMSFQYYQQILKTRPNFRPASH